MQSRKLLLAMADVPSAGCDWRCGYFCDAGIATVARVKLYPFYGSILSEILLSYSRSVFTLTGVAVAEVVYADVAGESAGTVIARCGMSFSGLVPGDMPLFIF